MSRIRIAREEMELNIEERLADVERLREGVQKQLEAEAKLEKEISDMTEKEK